MKKLSKVAGGVLAVAVTLLGVIAASPAAQAINCPTGTVCVYYSAGMTGSYVTYGASVATISGNYSAAGLAGYGSPVRNDAHSIYNNTASVVTVYVSPNYTGGSQTFQPYTGGNLVAPVLNNEASVKIGTPPPPPPAPTPSCASNAVCLYYSAGMTGSFATYTASVPTISGNYLVAGLAGYGTPVHANAHSVTNNTGSPVTVYVSPNYTGGSQTFQAHTSGNLVSPVLNNESSVRIGTPPPTPSCATNAVCLYYGAGMTGSFASYTGSVATISGTYTVTGLAGYGTPIHANAHSVTNNTGSPVTVYVSPNYTGDSQTFQAHTSGNLVSPVLNNESSLRIGTPPAPTPVPTCSGQPLALLPATVSISAGSTYQLLGNSLATPSTTCTWRSSNTSVVTVTATGLAKGVGGGSATVTVTAPNGATASTKVTVNTVPTNIPSYTNPGPSSRVVPQPMGTTITVFSRSWVKEPDAFDKAYAFMYGPDWLNTVCDFLSGASDKTEFDCTMIGASASNLRSLQDGATANVFTQAAKAGTCVALYTGWRFDPVGAVRAESYSGTYCVD